MTLEVLKKVKLTIKRLELESMKFNKLFDC